MVLNPGTTAMPTTSNERATPRDAKAAGCDPVWENAPFSWRTSTSPCGDGTPGSVSASSASAASGGDSVSTAAASKAGTNSSGSVCTESIAV